MMDKPENTKKSIGVKALLDHTFETIGFSDKWLESFGDPEVGFNCLIFGKKKNGKTEFSIQSSKYLSSFGKVYYNSFEQGRSKSLQDAAKRNKLNEIPAGKMMFGIRDTFESMMYKLKRNGAKFIFIDSRDYMKLTVEQYKEMTARYPKKSFFIICWEKGGKEEGEDARKISHMVDIIIHVKDFVAYPTSRFGGNAPFTIMKKSRNSGDQLDIFNTENKQHG